MDSKADALEKEIKNPSLSIEELDLPDLDNPELEDTVPHKETTLNHVFRDRHLWFWSDRLGFIGGPQPKRKGFVLILFSWAAGFIDALVILALSMVFVSMFSYFAKVILGYEVLGVFARSNPEALILSVLILFQWLYQVSMRSFWGYTLGEWTYDLRVGLPHERLLLSYAFRVALRSTVIVLTGVVTLPILSLLTGRDITGYVSGIKIFSMR